MTFVIETDIRQVKDISSEAMPTVQAFLQGAVYCWIKNRPHEPFSLRELVGGENTDWSATPLQVLYDKHVDKGKNENKAFEGAAKDAGWLLKSVLHKDERRFDVEKSGLVNAYRWIDREIPACVGKQASEEIS